MTTVLDPETLKDTILWKQLNSGYDGSTESDLAKQLAIKSEAICKEASERIKLFPYYHPQYTLHDQTHMLRVCELMAMVVGEFRGALNPIEVFLLICAAHMHDQGMVPDAEEWSQIKESADYEVSLEKWGVENPNLQEIRRQLNDNRYSKVEKARLRAKEQELLDAHRTDFLRITHGERSEQIVNKLYAADDRLNVCGRNLAQILGKLCVSHVWPASQLTDSTGFRVDEAVGTYTVNLRYLAVVLRLADILDLDQDRTPEVLLKTIHFASPISIEEWSKHRSVTGWEISSELVRFSLQCEHPAFQRAAYVFMDWIDHELYESHSIINQFPRDVPNHYKLNLPRQVDRKRIEPLNHSYRYEDLEFSLSREEIVKLLMTDQLYNDKSLFIRELLQNSLDALRYRVAIYGQGKPDWDGGSIQFEHTVDQHGYQVVRCTDNGIGMDENIIKNFLTKAGRSYYRSPEFEQQRIGFRQKSVDFDPCAQFGIGFMSCFMFGDRIMIYSRRDYGPDRGYGPPLKIEVNGLGGLIVIRDGDKNQEVGTTVEITGPRKPAYLDDWEDTVNLCPMIEGYALATEFPISAITTIEEIQCKLTVPPEISPTQTILEEYGINKLLVLEQSFSKIHPSLKGAIRASFLIDKNNIPTLENDEARFEAESSKTNESKIYLQTNNNRYPFYGFRDESSVCIDGIFVAGKQGGPNANSIRRYTDSQIHLGDPFILDIRGKIKPLLTPSRRPPQSFLGTRKTPATWKKIQRLADKAHTSLWEEFFHTYQQNFENETFWKLSLLHRAPVHKLNSEILWNHISIPVISSNDAVDWVALPEINQVICNTNENDRKSSFSLTDGRCIGFGSELTKWYPSGAGDPAWMLKLLLMRFSYLSLDNNNMVFNINFPIRSDDSSDNNPGFGNSFGFINCLSFDSEIADLISAQTEVRVANKYHPLVKYIWPKYEIKSELKDVFHLFCDSLVWCLSDRECLNEIDSQNIQNGRRFRRLGILYNHIDWSQYDKRYKPPYKIWCKQSGFMEITEEDLRRWSSF